MFIEKEVELDLIEMALYGNILRDDLHCRVYSIFELFPNFLTNSSSPSPLNNDINKIPTKQKGLPNCQ